MLVPFGAFADGKKDCVTGDPRCEAWLSGKGSPPGKPVTCLVLVVAHVQGGKVSMDVWREKDVATSRWGGIPRIKTAGKGREVRWNIGCGYITDAVTKWIYFCVEFEGKQYYFLKQVTQDVRVEVLRTKRLDICIGPQCPPPKKNE